MSIYEITLQNEDLELVPFSEFKGKVVIVVNTASLCGFTPQYRELEQLYQKYKDDGLVVLAFPCNQFANEEPLPIKKVAENVRRAFGVTFPIMNKVIVNGPGTHPLYAYLKSARPGKLGFKGVMWNFEKFIIDKHGRVVQRFLSHQNPLAFEPYIKALLTW